MNVPRYAIYFAPPADTPLWRFGSAVIGFDAETGQAVPFPDGPPFDAPDWAALTAEPRRYGFHATLKAPFTPLLAEPTEQAIAVFEAGVAEAARTFARGQAPFVVPELVPARLGAFVALVPASPSEALAGLAADCVRSFEPFRAPLSREDRERRLKSPLSPRQIEHLDRWGYPYVFDEFRFHMTLTGPLPQERRADIHAALGARYAELAGPLPVDGIAVFRQCDRSRSFEILGRFPFGG